VEKVFPYTTPPLANEDYRVAKIDEEKGVVIDWEVKKVKQEMEYHYYPVFYKQYEFANADVSLSGAVQPSGSSFGVGGSMARFGLFSDYLYVVDNSTLYIF
ncbi:MAG: hypothetical protein CUN57_03995, partial [Phototrophicales bacterium]